MKKIYIVPLSPSPSLLMRPPLIQYIASSLLLRSKIQRERGGGGSRCKWGKRPAVEILTSYIGMKLVVVCPRLNDFAIIRHLENDKLVSRC
jgi:hypothetical protein